MAVGWLFAGHFFFFRISTMDSAFDISLCTLVGAAANLQLLAVANM